jgi:hypothetical protein
MPPRDTLRRKLTVRALGQTLVLVKRPEETGEHVVQKALLWARHLPAYPGLRVEQRLPFPSRYKPDLYALDATGLGLIFWGECGMVGAEKLRALLRGYPATHFAFSKWATRLEPYAALIEDALRGVRRAAPVELIGFPEEAAAWLDEGRELRVPRDALDLRRWG